MNIFLMKLLEEGIKNHCKALKNIIEIGIIDYDTIINATIETKNARIIYEIAKNIAKPEDLPRLEETICKTGDSHYIFYFAKNVQKVSIKNLIDAVIIDNDPSNIKYFLLQVELNMELQNNLVYALMRLGKFEDLYDILTANILKDVNIINTIKSFISKNRILQGQYQNLIEDAKNDKLDNLQANAEEYKSLLSDEEGKKVKVRTIKNNESKPE